MSEKMEEYKSILNLIRNEDAEEEIKITLSEEEF